MFVDDAQLQVLAGGGQVDWGNSMPRLKAAAPTVAPEERQALPPV